MVNVIIDNYCVAINTEKEALKFRDIADLLLKEYSGRPNNKEINYDYYDPLDRIDTLSTWYYGYNNGFPNYSPHAWKSMVDLDEYESQVKCHLGLKVNIDNFSII